MKIMVGIEKDVINTEGLREGGRGRGHTKEKRGVWQMGRRRTWKKKKSA